MLFSSRAVGSPEPFFACVLVVLVFLGIGYFWIWPFWRAHWHVRRHRKQAKRGFEAFGSADFDMAIQQFQAGLDCPLCGYDVFAQLMVGSCLQMQGKYEQALAEYEFARQAAPDLPTPLTRLAYLLACAPDAKLRDGRRAAALARKACELSTSDDWESLTILAVAEAELGRFDQAVATYEEAMSLMPEEHQEIRLETLAQLRSGQPVRCNPDFDRSRLF